MPGRLPHQEGERSRAFGQLDGSLPDSSTPVFFQVEGYLLLHKALGLAGFDPVAPFQDGDGKIHIGLGRDDQVLGLIIGQKQRRIGQDGVLLGLDNLDCVRDFVCLDGNDSLSFVIRRIGLAVHLDADRGIGRQAGLRGYGAPGF